MYWVGVEVKASRQQPGSTGAVRWKPAASPAHTRAPLTGARNRQGIRLQRISEAPPPSSGKYFLNKSSYLLILLIWCPLFLLHVLEVFPTCRGAAGDCWLYIPSESTPPLHRSPRITQNHGLWLLLLFIDKHHFLLIAVWMSVELWLTGWAQPVFFLWTSQPACYEWAVRNRPLCVEYRK